MSYFQVWVSLASILFSHTPTPPCPGTCESDGLHVPSCLQTQLLLVYNGELIHNRPFQYTIHCINKIFITISKFCLSTLDSANTYSFDKVYIHLLFSTLFYEYLLILKISPFCLHFPGGSIDRAAELEGRDKLISALCSGLKTVDCDKII